MSAPVKVTCERCNGTGVWVRGPIVNGVPAAKGTCYRCKGKGHQTPEDQRRNAAYDNLYAGDRL